MKERGLFQDLADRMRGESKARVLLAVGNAGLLERVEALGEIDGLWAVVSASAKGFGPDEMYLFTTLADIVTEYEEHRWPIDPVLESLRKN